MKCVKQDEICNDENTLQHLRPDAAKRMAKICSYVLDNPGCSRSDIYNHSGATTNYEDFKHDIDYLVSINSLIRINSAGEFFKEPIKKEFLDVFKCYQFIDDMAKGLKQNPNLQDYEIARQIMCVSPDPKKVNYHGLIDTYDIGIAPARSESDQLFSKVAIILIQKIKISNLEHKRFQNKMKDVQTILHDSRKAYHDLPKKARSAKSPDELMKIVTETMHKKMIYDSFWKEFKVLSKREDASRTAFVNFLKYSEEILFKVCTNPLDASQIYDKNVAARLDQTYDDDRKYLLSLRSTNKRSLKERLEIQGHIYR